MWDKLLSVMDNWYFIGGMLCALVLILALAVVGVVVALATRKSASTRGPRRREP